MTENLDDKKILVIGAGNMATPMIIGILKQQGIKPGNVTVICGESSGKDKQALLAALGKADCVLPEENIVSRSEVKQDGALLGKQYDIAIYAAKPDNAREILEADKRFFTLDVTLLTIAGGLPVEFYKQFVGEGGGVVRAMPHLPKKVVGLYAEDERRIALVEPLLQGISEKILRLDDEYTMHAYSAHAGSGPAFVAQYVLEMEMEGKRADAIESLRAVVKGEQPASAGARTIHLRTEKFYQQWVNTMFGMPGMISNQVLDSLNATILGTLELLENGKPPEPPEALIERVRSPKGITNAGLIVLGHPPPREDKHGTPEQHERQRELARRYENVAIEEKIGAALVATVLRSRALAEIGEPAASNPLMGVGMRLKRFNDFVPDINSAVARSRTNGKA